MRKNLTRHYYSTLYIEATRQNDRGLLNIICEAFEVEPEKINQEYITTYILDKQILTFFSRDYKNEYKLIAPRKCRFEIYYNKEDNIPGEFYHIAKERITDRLNKAKGKKKVCRR